MNVAHNKLISAVLVMGCLASCVVAFSAQPNSTNSTHKLRIAVASSFYPALLAVKQQLEREHNTDLQIISGSSSMLSAQILHGAPFDLFLSADKQRPLTLSAKGIGVAQPQLYAKAPLALVSNSPFKHWQQSIEFIKTNNKKVALADPRFAPVGLAAADLLEKLQLPRVLWRVAENSALSLHYLHIGHVDWALVTLSQALLASDKGLTVQTVLATEHRPINYYLLLLTESTSAKKVAQSLLSQSIQSRLQSLGYLSLHQSQSDENNER